VFADARISLWREQLPEVDNPASRVRTIIDLLRDKRDAARQNGLILLLRVLADQTVPADACYHDLIALAEALASQVTASGVFELPAAGDEVGNVYKAVYHNLPQPDYGRFIGREEELTKVARILRPYPHSQHASVTIDGIGGIGKSALALEIAHRYLRNYAQIPPAERFEAIVWTSAKQNVLTAEGIKARRQVLRTLNDIYTAIAVCLEREDITRARAEEQDDLVRKALTRQRTLLIVDNLETVDDEAVLDFIREIPAPTKVMVTTRHRIDVAYSVRLMGMPEQDGLALIAQECQKKAVELTGAQSQRLYERTGGVPLAIVWSVALMGYGYSVDTVLRRLGEPQADISRFCFEETVARIKGTPAYRLMLALAFFVTNASREALGHIAELSVLDRDEGLVKLEQLSLINKKQDRFMFLPLTRAFAVAELYHDPGYEKLGGNWLNYLRQLCQSADTEYYWYHIVSDFYNDGDNVLAAIQWAYEHGTADDIFKLSLAAFHYLEANGQWDTVIEICNQALSLARSIQNSQAIARFDSLIGWIAADRGDYQQAEELFCDALETYRRMDNREGEYIALIELSSVHRKRREFSKSWESSHQAWDIVRDLESDSLTAMVQVELGKLARDTEDWESAWRYFTDVRVWYEKRTEKFPREESLFQSIYGHLAIVSYCLKRPREAKELCLKSIEFFEHQGTKAYLATLKYRLALAEEALEEYEEALQHTTEALYWYEHLGMNPDYAKTKKLWERLRSQSGGILYA